MSRFTHRLALLLAGSALCGAALVAGVPTQASAPKPVKTTTSKAPKTTPVKHRHSRHGKTKKVVKTTTTTAPKAPASAAKS
ncbi:MAG: hypothetical protein KGN80_08930 [Acidobacteriota bacterium]|nr:hypothetical protein [Acidobacteriota bacterium]